MFWKFLIRNHQQTARKSLPYAAAFAEPEPIMKAVHPGNQHRFLHRNNRFHLSSKRSPKLPLPPLQVCFEFFYSSSEPFLLVIKKACREKTDLFRSRTSPANRKSYSLMWVILRSSRMPLPGHFAQFRSHLILSFKAQIFCSSDC